MSTEIIDKINRQFGTGTIQRLGDGPMIQRGDRIPTGYEELDEILGVGGWPQVVHDHGVGHHLTRGGRVEGPVEVDGNVGLGRSLPGGHDGHDQGAAPHGELPCPHYPTVFARGTSHCLLRAQRSLVWTP